MSKHAHFVLSAEGEHKAYGSIGLTDEATRLNLLLCKDKQTIDLFLSKKEVSKLAEIFTKAERLMR